MKVTLAQVNPVVGDVEGNLGKIGETLDQCKDDLPDLIVFSELFITGYPPRDLLERRWFIEKCQAALDQLVEISKDYPQTGILVGAPIPTGKQTGRGLYDSAVLIHKGKRLFTQHKSLLCTYDVFDEARYFDPAPKIAAVSFKGEKLGISICEDAWNDPELWRWSTYPFDPIETLAAKGATLMVNLSASPFYIGKEKTRFRLVQRHAKKHGVPFVLVNQIGANDEVIFDGRSFAVDRNGAAVAIFPSFEEHLQTIDTTAKGDPELYTPQEEIASVHDALVLGIRDYMRKCGFTKAVIGLSGGIDSAIVCVLAQHALGKDNVLGVTMPGPYSSKGSIEDSKALAKNLDIAFKEIPISSVYSSYLLSLKEHFGGKGADVTEENIQARIRGNILMALSNKLGHLVLSTGNKSELAVGYCTLYGDMTGGLAVLADVPKTMVYELAGYLNRDGQVIPQATIDKPPSAELKDNQTDQDTLPPYDVLDAILDHYLEDGLSSREIIEKGFDPQVVRWVIRAVNTNEYKRQQAAPVLKVTTKAFGIGRRMPIAAKYEA
jgi:NAD+ synthase (glutamine-hydrolysing)